MKRLASLTACLLILLPTVHAEDEKIPQINTLAGETDTISENTLNGGQPLLDLVEFYALSVSATEVGFAIADSIKITRPYPNKSVMKRGELKDSSEKS